MSKRAAGTSRLHSFAITVALFSLALILPACKKSKSNGSTKTKSNTESKPVVFRGNQFTTIVPGGWVVSFPDESTRFQVGKLGDGKKPGYAAVIRLDVGKPKKDLPTTAKQFADDYDLETSDEKFDWAGQDAILLKGEPQGVLKPQQLLLCVRFNKLFILSVATEKEVDVQSEFDLLLKNWAWDEK